MKKLVFVTGIVSLFFLFASTVKIFGRPHAMFEYQLENYFIGYGLNRQIMFLIGLAELCGAITIWYHRTHWIGLLGAAVLVVVTTGARRLMNLKRVTEGITDGFFWFTTLDKIRAGEMFGPIWLRGGQEEPWSLLGEN